MLATRSAELAEITPDRALNHPANDRRTSARSPGPMPIGIWGV